MLLLLLHLLLNLLNLLKHHLLVQGIVHQYRFPEDLPQLRHQKRPINLSPAPHRQLLPPLQLQWPNSPWRRRWVRRAKALVEVSITSQRKYKRCARMITFVMAADRALEVMSLVDTVDVEEVGEDIISKAGLSKYPPPTSISRSRIRSSRRMLRRLLSRLREHRVLKPMARVMVSHLLLLMAMLLSRRLLRVRRWSYPRRTKCTTRKRVSSIIYRVS